MQRRSYYKKFEYKGNYYMLSREECEEIYIDELDISKELKKKLFLRASYIHELVTAYDVLRFNSNEYLDKELNKNREKIITIEDEIKSLYGEEISGLKIYHPISANTPFEYEEQEFYFCSSCESVIAPEQKKVIDDLRYECALNEGVETAEEKFGGLCPLCNKKKSLYLQNIHCAKANKLIEKSQSLIDAEKYEEACDCSREIIKELEKIDVFFEDLYGEAQSEIGRTWMTIIRIRNDVKAYQGQDYFCENAIKAYKKARQYGALVEPQWMVEIYMLYLVAKDNDEESTEISLEDIKEILEEMVSEAKFSKQFYKDNFVEVYPEKCRECDNFLIYGHMAALDLYDRYHVPLTETQELKGKTIQIIKESNQHSAAEKREYLSLFSEDITGHSDGNGCYIATAVYGSYNCEQVWTLRRFRDDYLKKRLWGKAFIKFYYRVSPQLVVQYGNRMDVVALVKKMLDYFVTFLNKRGYSNERYTE